jgi:hypothetical protein
MCTVSFLPVREKVFITSNRDEKKWRKPALLPEVHEMDHGAAIFPKDGDAGGTWITLCENRNAGVLLNGAFEKHIPKDRYRKSRGLVFLDVMDHRRPLHNFLKMPLAGIEPFTLVLWQENNLYECRLDDSGKKFCKALKNYRPYIWSSATLYDEEIRRKREQWFLKWLNAHPVPTRKEILHFHRFAGEGDAENDLLMNRDGKVFTVSITSIEISEDKGTLYYSDVLTNEVAQHRFQFSDNLILT